MRFKARPEDFVVSERLRGDPSPDGPFALLRIRKRGLSTLEVHNRLAAALRVPNGQIAFPALKDKDALTVQYATVSLAAARIARPAQAEWPAQDDGERGYRVEFAGCRAKPLMASDLAGNTFALVIRDLSLDEAQQFRPRLAQIGAFGLPNYFDEQRFGSYAGASGFIGKRILLRDAEGAVRIYLSEKMAGDPERVRVYKEFAAAHWGDWTALMEQAPRPSNFRSVLTYLKDHPQDGWRKALNLIPPNLLALYLSAYQSWLWNQIAARTIAGALAEAGFTPAHLRVAGQDLPVYRNLPESLRARLERMLIPLPNHQARWPDPAVEAAANAVLAAEALTLNDFKARILKRAFVSRSSRPLIVRPDDARAGNPEGDDLTRRRFKVSAEFTLPPGAYATIVLKALGAAG